MEGHGMQLNRELQQERHPYCQTGCSADLFMPIICLLYHKIIWACLGSVWALLDVTASSNGTRFDCTNVFRNSNVARQKITPKVWIPHSQLFEKYSWDTKQSFLVNFNSKSILSIDSPSKLFQFLYSGHNLVFSLRWFLVGWGWEAERKRMKGCVACKWILGTPIKPKKETEEEDVAGCWNALWATFCLWLGQNLHTFFFFFFSFLCWAPTGHLPQWHTYLIQQESPSLGSTSYSRYAWMCTLALLMIYLLQLRGDCELSQCYRDELSL